jgi:hypothetical protein
MKNGFHVKDLHRSVSGRTHADIAIKKKRELVCRFPVWAERRRFKQT